MSEEFSDERKALINEFVEFTGVESSHAFIMLEAYQWNYDAAVTGYFDSFDDGSGSDPHGSSTDAGLFGQSNFGSNQALSGSNQALSGISSPDEDQKSPEPAASCSNISKSKDASRGRGGSSNIATLATLATGDHDHSSSSNSDGEEGQAFYAGGSVHSGQQVLGPSKKAKGIVKEMFKSAISHGAELVNPKGGNRDAARVIAFKGVGHTLGSTASDSVMVSGVSDESSGNAQPAEVCLKAWRNGFSIDDGPLRDYEEAENKAFLNDVRRGEVPQELTRRLLTSQGKRNFDGEIHLTLEDHSAEDFMPPKLTLQAFSGTGHRLGSPTPALTHLKPFRDTEHNENEARVVLKVDETQPSTTVQVRLLDGTRLKITVNAYHSVGDIRRYIVNAHPEYGTLTFILMNSSSYPMQELEDDSVTIEQANLFNAVLVQRIK